MLRRVERVWLLACLGRADLLPGDLEQLETTLLGHVFVAHRNEHLLLLHAESADFFAEVADDIVVVLDVNDVAPVQVLPEHMSMQQGRSLQIDILREHVATQRWTRACLRITSQLSAMQEQSTREMLIKLMVMLPSLSIAGNVQAFTSLLIVRITVMIHAL